MMYSLSWRDEQLMHSLWCFLDVYLETKTSNQNSREHINSSTLHSKQYYLYLQVPTTLQEMVH